MDERENDMKSETVPAGGAEGATQARAQKRAWQSPSLTYIGDLEDLVQGGGKRGSFLDSDPRGPRKGGGG
jgi:hypothetical protein